MTDTATYPPAYAAIRAARPTVMTSQHYSPRSIEMFTMHEALAREHQRQLESQAREHALARRLASARRWRYLERRAHAAYRRHAQRAYWAAQVSTVVD